MMRRRQYIATALGAVSIGTAGCRGQQSETSPTNTPETAQADDLGQTIATDDGIEITYEEFLKTGTVVTTNARTSASGGRLLALLKLRIRNNTGESTRLPEPEEFEITAGEAVYRRVSVAEPTGLSDDSGVIQQPIQGDEYRPSGLVDPGAVTAGWLVIPIPEEQRDLKLTLTEAVTDSGEELQWSVVSDNGDLALCSVDFTAPETLTQRTEAGFTVTMENTGNRQSRCYRRYQVSGEIERDSYTVFRNLSPGESFQTSFSVTPPGIGEFVVETNGETVVDTTVQPQTHDFGDSWTSPRGLRMTVSNVQFAREASYEQQWEDETATVEASNGSTFAFFFIEARNVGNNDALDPPHRLVGVRAEVNDTVSEFYEIDNDIPSTWTAPVDGTAYNPDRLGYDPGEGLSGWFVAEVPASATLSETTLRVTMDTLGRPEIGTEWTGSD